MILSKPKSIADLRPPFLRVGELGWDARLQRLFNAYGLEAAEAIGLAALEVKEATLGFGLDTALKRFLRAFGSVDFRCMRVLKLSEIGPLTEVCFAPQLSAGDRARLPHLVAVMDYLGTGDFLAWDRQVGGYWLVRHDPVGVHPWLSTFDDCVREQCVELAVGYYGWSDPEVEQLVAQAKREFFPLLGRAWSAT